jgi:hypothetical protein
MMKTTSNNMRWSTYKFAMDILWACGECNITVEGAIKVLDTVTVKYYTCPIIDIFNQTQTPLVLLKETNKYSWLNLVLNNAPYYEEMAQIWPATWRYVPISLIPPDLSLCRSRIKAVKRWFKDNGYLK